MAGYSSASWAIWCARNGRITKDTPPPFISPNTTFGYTPPVDVPPALVVGRQEGARTCFLSYNIGGHPLFSPGDRPRPPALRSRGGPNEPPPGPPGGRANAHSAVPHW